MYFQKMSIPALNVHPSCLLNLYEKRPLSNLSTQPCKFWSSNCTSKIIVDMFPCTHFSPSGRVDNFDANSEIRLNKGLQPRHQCDALHMWFLGYFRNKSKNSGNVLFYRLSYQASSYQISILLLRISRLFPFKQK